MCVFSVSLHDFFFTMQLKTSAEVGHLIIFSFSIGTCNECSNLNLPCTTVCYPGCYCNNTYLSGSTANTQYRIMPYNGVCGACPKSSTTAPATTRTEGTSNPTTVSTIHPIATEITTKCGPCAMFTCALPPEGNFDLFMPFPLSHTGLHLTPTLFPTRTLTLLHTLGNEVAR